MFANGISIHVAELGDGPLVLLLHGFAEYWWVWHRQLSRLADAGYRAVAADMRGYGDTDKTPRGYDGWTLAGDIAGLVRALGARRAHIVGHGWGGSLAWTTATMHPRVVDTLVVVGGAHPTRFAAALRRGMVSAPQWQSSRHALWFQIPLAPESALLADDAAAVERYLRAWSGPAWPDTDDFTETAQRLRAAMRIPAVAHCGLEYYRWAFRSLFRGDGRRFAAAVRTPCGAPILQLHGTEDTCVRPHWAHGSTRWAGQGSRLHELAGVGHYPHLEAPDAVTDLLLQWLAQ